MNSDDETLQMWHFILCREHDAIRNDAGCNGTQCRKFTI
jgi:hypothetical protein